jgi:phage shock protein A
LVRQISIVVVVAFRLSQYAIADSSCFSAFLGPRSFRAFSPIAFTMIFGKMWSALRAQLNKFANFFWSTDPIAQMQYEYDTAVEELKSGRVGLEQYRALVERVTLQVARDKKHVDQLAAKVKAYLQAGDRETAAKFALELQQAKEELAENQTQLEMHEKAYGNNVTKIKHANDKLAKVRDKIKRYDAEIKMSRAEAEMAKLAQSFDFDVTTDFGQIEAVIEDKISLNRAKARVAADLSEEGLEDVQREQAMESALAADALRQFEVEMGLVTPETVNVPQSEKQLGPVERQTQVES